MWSLGIEPTTFCAADAMLYHWATQEHSGSTVIVWSYTRLLFCAKKTKVTISSFLGQSVTIHKSIMMRAFGATDVEHACAAPSLQAENAHVHILVLSIMPPVFGRSESSRIWSKIS